MKELWRKSIALLRNHPVLVLPFVFSELLTGSVSWLRHLASSGVIRWVSHRQIESVLGENFGSRAVDAASMRTASRLNSALSWGTHYVSISIETAALVLTVIMAGLILHNEQPVLAATAAARLRAYPKRILLYSAKAWLLTLVLSTLITFFLYLPASRLRFGSPSFSVLSSGLGLLGTACLAWVMAPIAIRLLRSAGSPAISNQERELGRYAFLLAAAAGWAIGFLLHPLISELSHRLPGATEAVVIFSSLIINLPYVQLYIALAFIADASLEVHQMPGDPRLRKLLRAAMPLHFERRGES